MTKYFRTFLFIIMTALSLSLFAGTAASAEETYSDGTVLMVRKEEADDFAISGTLPEISEFSDLSGKKVATLIGGPSETIITNKAPDVGKIDYYNSIPDMIQALKTKKVDAFLANNAMVSLLLNRNPDLALFPKNLTESSFGIAFKKGDTKREEWEKALSEIPRSQIEEAFSKWTGSDESVKILPKQDWEGKNGTVSVAIVNTIEPLCYVGDDGELKGFDAEVILMIAKKLDMKVEFTGMELASMLAFVQSGKADLGIGSINITPERAQTVDFIPYYPSAFELIVRGVPESQVAKDDSFFAAIRESFLKTFVREGRWKLFLEGVGTTLLITLLSVLFGTALGSAAFMWCRGGNPVANLITKILLAIVRGMPMVVILMVLYFIIFGSVQISGIAVAVIGFTLTFGAAVFGLLKMGVGAIDKGQYEAAYALGYSNHRTFFKIILPQALQHVLPGYKGQVVELIKGTAIVGYIAVQDLTKMGDIIRSRTYEAFFPLIAVTVIYFALEWIIGALINRLSIDINPKRRKPEKILKGIEN